MCDEKLGRIPDRFPERRQAFGTLGGQDSQIRGDRLAVFAFFPNLLFSLLKLFGRLFLGLEEQAFSLPVDFETIKIILVLPFAIVRNYSQLSACHSLRFA